MINKTFSVLSAAVISFGIGIATTSGAIAGPAVGELLTSVHADVAQVQNAAECCIPSQPARKAENWSRTKLKRAPKIQLHPKVCYDRRRVGPQNYVIVRRAC